MAYNCGCVCDWCGDSALNWTNCTVSMSRCSQIARSEGWEIGKNGWLCPVCRKKIREKGPSGIRKPTELLRKEYETAYQWLTKGYVVKKGMRGKRGRELQQPGERYFANSYCYYHITDCDYAPKEAMKILENFSSQKQGKKYWGQRWW